MIDIKSKAFMEHTNGTGKVGVGAGDILPEANNRAWREQGRALKEFSNILNAAFSPPISLSDTVDRIKHEIVQEAIFGQIPMNCQSLGALNDVPNSGLYGGIASFELNNAFIEHFGGLDENKELPSGYKAFIAQAHAEVDEWLHDGGLAVACEQVDTIGKAISREGIFSGVILDVSNGIAIQKVNREGHTVFHSIASLDNDVKKGDLVDIAYIGGKGMTTVRNGPRQDGGIGR
jgi:hypothetical protein